MNKNINYAIKLFDFTLDSINDLEQIGMTKEPNMRLEFIDETYWILKFISNFETTPSSKELESFIWSILKVYILPEHSKKLADEILNFLKNEHL